jgi:hypothetical protein
MDMVFAWLDTRETRPSDARAYALLNDADQVVKTDVADAFLSYDVRPIRWSERENVRDELAA